MKSCDTNRERRCLLGAWQVASVWLKPPTLPAVRHLSFSLTPDTPPPVPPVLPSLLRPILIFEYSSESCRNYHYLFISRPDDFYLAKWSLYYFRLREEPPLLSAQRHLKFRLQAHATYSWFQKCVLICKSLMVYILGYWCCFTHISISLAYFFIAHFIDNNKLCRVPGSHTYELFVYHYCFFNCINFSMCVSTPMLATPIL